MTTNSAKAKATQKRNFIVLSILIGVGVFGLSYLLSGHSSKELSEKSNQTNFVNPLDHIDAESIVLEKTQKELRETKEQTNSLQEKYDSLSSTKKTEDAISQKTNEELMARVAELEKKISSTPNGMDNTHLQGQMQGSDYFQGNDLQETSINQNPQGVMGRGIREDTLILSPKESEEEKKPLKNPDTYVPAGSFGSAVMLSGSDASAAVNAQADPEPMTFEFLDNGNMPNHTKSHLKGCRVTAAGKGDISSERGKAILQRLSCTFSNGETVEQEVEGYIAGPDGKNGVRGIPVWRDGAMTQRMFTAGFLSGVANGVSSSYTTNSVSPQGAVQTIDSGRILQNGVANGSAKAMDKLSDYYIQRAEQYHPIIQLSPGVVVDVVFLKGFFLDGKTHENKDPSVGNYGMNKKGSSFAPAVFPTQPNDSEAQTLPLSEESVRRIQEHSKELGLRVTSSNG